MAAEAAARLRAGASERRHFGVLLAGGIGVGGAAAMLVVVLSGVGSPYAALFGCLGAVAIAAALWSPRAALWVLCCSVPFERIGRLTNDFEPVAISVSRLLGIVALVSLLLHAALRREKLRFGWPIALYAGYTGMALLTNAWADSPEDTFRQCFAVVGNLLFFFFVTNLIRSYPDARRAVLIWLCATMAAAVFSVGDYFLSTRNIVGDAGMGLTSTRLTTVVDDGSEARTLGTNVRRLFGTTAHPTLFGLNNLMAVPFFLWAMRARRRQALLWFGGLLLSLLCVLLSNTRAVMLLAVFMVVYCLWRRLWWPNIQAVIALAVLAAAIIPCIPEDVYRRTLDPTLYTTEKGDSIRVRFKFWQKSWELIQETWTHGIGVGNGTTVVERVTDESTGVLTAVGLRASAHNEYIWVMVEVGILGYLFHWGFVALVTADNFRAAARFRGPDAAEQRLFLYACQAILIGVLLFAVQSEVFHYPLKAWWLVAAIGPRMLEFARAGEAAAPTEPAPFPR